MNNEIQDVRKRLASWGARLIGVGLLTGVWAGFALTGVVSVAQPRLALGAHLSALLGGFWILGVAFSFEFLKYPVAELRLLSKIVILANWGNWAVTLLASFLGVNGLIYSHEPANNLVALLLQTVVVIPSLGAAWIWVRGFC